MLQSWDNVANMHELLCFAGQLSRKSYIREWHLSLSQYKMTAFVTCSITELSTSKPLPLPTGQLTYKAQYS